MEANVAAGGGDSLAHAIDAKDPSLIEGGVDITQIDTADGEKIVTNVFGGETDNVISALGSQGGGANIIGSVLPMLAPILMSFLANKMGGNAQAGLNAGAGGQGGLEDLLGGLLGGSGGQGGAGGIGDLLGGLLGGGRH